MEVKREIERAAGTVGRLDLRCPREMAVMATQRGQQVVVADLTAFLVVVIPNLDWAATRLLWRGVTAQLWLFPSVVCSVLSLAPLSAKQNELSTAQQ